MTDVPGASRLALSLLLAACAGGSLAASACEMARPPPEVPATPAATSTPAPSPAPPSLAPSAASSPAPPSTPAPSPAPHVVLARAGTRVPGGPCTRLLVAPMRAPVRAALEHITAKVEPIDVDPGDVLTVSGAVSVTMSGDAVVATVTRFCAIDDHPPLVFEMTPSSASRELRWANGRMTAHLDVGPPLSTELYMGRLAGTAPVAEHTHPTSWEVLAALEGSGIFTLDGREQRLVAPQLVVVPPNTKHAWKPDPGTRLQAIQVYAPPGPEQRFLALDAAAGDGGAPR